ncbi:MAG TPA: DEAD/DEAH box helicase [Rectinema sp.]|nr:DEAD/DEAH box helicase [Rectinema sp.]
MKTLYPYQQEDVDKLKDLPYGLIASEMGTGKSYEGIALGVEWIRQVLEGTGQLLPVLIICPINTFSSWKEKFEEQIPQLDVMVIDRKYRDHFVLDMKRRNHDIYIMHWAGVNYLAPEFQKAGLVFSAVVADEVHAISNRNSSTKKNLMKIKAYAKLGLSGTPCGDKPWQLWSILNWLDKTRYSSYWKFVNRYVEEEYEYRRGAGGQLDKYRVFKTPKNLELLHRSIKPFYVRHLKQEQCCVHHPNGVMEWLPEKTYETLTVELSDQQRKVYNEMEANMVAWLGEQDDTPLIAPIIIAQLTRLSQMTLATPVIKDDGTVDLTMPSSKYDILKALVTEYDNKQFLVFTSSKKMANLTVNELNKSSVESVVLSGDTPEWRRQTIVKDFQKKKYRVIVGVIEAAAEGIDGLQDVCDIAVFLDRSFKTIKNKQAEDRLHRGGQNNRVTIIDIQAENTVDQDREKLLHFKWDNIKKILDVA